MRNIEAFDARSSHLYTLGPLSDTRFIGLSRSLERFRIVLTWPSTSTSCMRRTDGGVTSGFCTRFSADMHSGQPSFNSCLRLYSLLISAPLQTSFSDGSSPLGGSLSPLIVSIICRPTRSRLRPHKDSQVHIQRSPTRPGRRMMVGTRTTARDWQWLDDIMAEDAPAAPQTQKIRRMPESYACRRGAGRPRRGGRAGKVRGEGGDTAPTKQTQGGASTSQAVEEAGTSS
ncbi:hypothetical protein PIB30_003536 [Stylosanthes scabra]|uniref:Uncharacterized protein n=1 Tax=Stylosanthes scabra TaxID=79078 RepID=A0ABU6W1H6_9FABA|nr:hypothetical protein [Stylosanthes scabra]